MKKVIGIVSEGPTDYLVLKAVIDKITGEENRYLSLQPEPDMLGRYGNGWKGVWKGKVLSRHLALSRLMQIRWKNSWEAEKNVLSLYEWLF